MVGVRQTRGDNICIPDNGSHLDYLGHTCLGFFCALHGGGKPDQGRALVDYIITPATIAHRVQTTKKPSPDPQEEKQEDAHDGYLTFSDSCLIVF